MAGTKQEGVMGLWAAGMETSGLWALAPPLHALSAKRGSETGNRARANAATGKRVA